MNYCPTLPKQISVYLPFLNYIIKDNVMLIHEHKLVPEALAEGD